MKTLLLFLLPFLTFAKTSISNTAIWDLKGNVVTNNNYFLGTKNAKDLIVKTNNTEALKVFTHGGIRFTQYNSYLDYQGTSVANLSVNAQGDVLTSEILLSKSPTNVTATPIQYVSGNLQISQSNGVILTAPNGNKWKLSITNNGQLILEQIL